MTRRTKTEENQFELTRSVIKTTNQRLILRPTDGEPAQFTADEFDEIKRKLSKIFDINVSSEADIVLKNGRTLHCVFNAHDVAFDTAYLSWSVRTDCIIEPNSKDASHKKFAQNPHKRSFRRHFAFIDADCIDLVPVDGKEAEIDEDDAAEIYDDIEDSKKGKLQWNGREYYYRYRVEKEVDYKVGHWERTNDSVPLSDEIDCNSIQPKRGE